MHQVIGKWVGQKAVLWAGAALLLSLTACGQEGKPSGESASREIRTETSFAGKEEAQDPGGPGTESGTPGASKSGETSNPGGPGTENGSPGALEEKSASGESGSPGGRRADGQSAKAL